jgi:galactonate dehydratase
LPRCASIRAWVTVSNAVLAPGTYFGTTIHAARRQLKREITQRYRTRFEVLPYFERGAIGVLQPDLGRSGITEARKLAVLADTHQVPVAPHVSIGLGPQIAAAIHFAAATPNLLLLECNPGVFELSARLAHDALEWSVAGVPVGREPGLGVRIDEDAVRRVAVGTAVATASR